MRSIQGRGRGTDQDEKKVMVNADNGSATANQETGIKKSWKAGEGWYNHARSSEIGEHEIEESRRLN